METIRQKYGWIFSTLLGSLIFALGFDLFLVPNNLNPGGISGLSVIIVELLGFEPGENLLQVILTADYQGFMLFFFENGKVAKVPLSAYETKTNRKKLTGAFCDKSPVRTITALDEDAQMVIYSSDGRAAIFSTAQLLPKTTRNTQGVAVLTPKKKAILDRAALLSTSGIVNESRYRSKTIPTAGALLREEDTGVKQETFEV